MTRSISLRIALASLLLAGLFLPHASLRAQTAAKPDQPTAVRSSGVVETGRQSVQAVGEATSELGNSLRSGRRQAVTQSRKLWQDVLLPAGQRFATAIPVVLKALILLLAFWLAGTFAGTCVTKLLNMTQIDDRAIRDWGLEGLLKQPDGQKRSLAKLVGGAVKWLLILFGFVAFFNALNLVMVAGPLQNILDRIIGAIPNLLKAAAILFVYWVIAAVARAGVTRALGAMKFDARFGKHLTVPADDDKQPPAPSVMIGRLLFYVILLFGVPPFLQALGQQALVAPLQEMLAKALGFLPNLFAAAIILIVGRIVATIVREVVSNVLSASGADAGAAKLGLGKVMGTRTLSGICGKIAYFFIFIPILVAAIDSLGITAISDPIKAMLQKILEAVPAMLVAAVIIAIGYVVAKIVRSLIESFLSGVGLDALPDRLGLSFLSAKEGQLPPSGVIGAATAVIIMLITAQQACASLRFQQLADLLRRVVEYLPSLLVGIVILLAALSLANYLAALVAKALEGHQNATLLSGVTRYAVLLLGAGMALEQLGVGKEIVTIAVAALFGGGAIAVGLAFGLGGKDRARELIESWNKK